MDWDEQESQQERRRSDGTRQRHRPDQPDGQSGQNRRSGQSRERSAQSREAARRPRETPGGGDQQAERRKAQQQAKRREEKRRAEQEAKRQAEKRQAQQQRAKRRQQQAERRKQAEKRRVENRRTPPKVLPRRQLLWKLLTTGAVVLALVLGMTIFFKVQNVQVTGNEKYTADTVLKASGIEIGDNLLTFGEARAAGKILAELPYVDQVQIGIKLPNTVNIDIVELEVTYAIQALDDSWWLMDASGKLLEPVEEAEATKHIRVLGVRVETPAAGQTLKAADPLDPAAEATEETEATEGVLAETPAERAAAALEILQALEASDNPGDVTAVDVSELFDLQLWYSQKYQVLLGGPTELSYKISYMIAALATLPDYQSGVLDITFQNERRGLFTPWQ